MSEELIALLVEYGKYLKEINKDMWENYHKQQEEHPDPWSMPMPYPANFGGFIEWLVQRDADTNNSMEGGHNETK